MSRTVRAKVTDLSITDATLTAQARARRYREVAENLAIDPQRQKRLAQHECPFCFYAAGRGGGCAMTERQCGHCDNLVRACGTNIDALCPECAGQLGLCCHCGGDIESKLRRKPRDLSQQTPDLFWADDGIPMHCEDLPASHPPCACGGRLKRVFTPGWSGTGCVRCGEVLPHGDPDDAQ